MGKYPATDAYIPDRIPDEELAYYEKGQMGGETGLGENPAVIVVDMTKAFVSDDYVSGRTETGQDAVKGNEKLLEAAREADLPIFYTILFNEGSVPDEYLARDGKELSEAWRKVYGEGNEVAEAIVPEEGDFVIQKPAPSAFFETNLSSMLVEYGIGSVIVTGMSTTGCVRSTVVDAASSNYDVVVPIECVADRCPTSAEMTLFDMDMKWADVRPLETVIDEIEQSTAVPADN